MDGWPWLPSTRMTRAFDPKRLLLTLSDCAATNGPNAYSITSSASASSFGGISRPSVLAVFEVDDQFDFDRLLHRQIGGVFAPEYPAGIDAHQTKSVSDAGSVTHQAARYCEFAQLIHRG